jgi:hypothetical protein
MFRPSEVVAMKNGQRWASLAVVLTVIGLVAVAAGGVSSTVVRDPGTSPEAFWGALDWADLSSAEQALWQVLGWDEASWSGEAPAPASEGLYWNELSAREQAAAQLLGYDATSWDGVETVDLLFVQSAGSGTYSDGRLILSRVLHTVFFSERPGRIVGQMSNADFVAHWSETGLNSFSDDPPNAALSMSGSGQVAIVEILDIPTVAEGNVVYNIHVLDGSIPSSFEAAVLFIDAYPTTVDGQITDSVTQAFATQSDAIPTPISGQDTD